MSNYYVELKKQEQRYQEKLERNEPITLADMAYHNEYIMKYKNMSFGVPEDIARVLNPKYMPKPTGKVYKG